MGPGPLFVRSEEAHLPADMYIRPPRPTPVGRLYPHAQYRNATTPTTPTRPQRRHLLHYQQEGDEQCLRPFCSGHEECRRLQSQRGGQ